MLVGAQEQSRVHQEPGQLFIVCIGLAEVRTVPGGPQQAEGSGCYPVLGCQGSGLLHAEVFPLPCHHSLVVASGCR